MQSQENPQIDYTDFSKKENPINEGQSEELKELTGKNSQISQSCCIISASF